MTLTELYAWAHRWGVPVAAVAELRQMMTATVAAPPVAGRDDEAGAQQQVRLAASQAGWRLWRNNVGVLRDERGVPVRYGLANETPAMNKHVKSSDLIGIKPTGQFVAREVKHPGWSYSGTPHEAAQLAFIELVVAMGGDAAFTTGEL